MGDGRRISWTNEPNHDQIAKNAPGGNVIAMLPDTAILDLSKTAFAENCAPSLRKLPSDVAQANFR